MRSLVSKYLVSTALGTSCHERRRGPTNTAAIFLHCVVRSSSSTVRRLNMKQMSTTIDVTDATSNIVMEPANYPPIETPIDF